MLGGLGLNIILQIFIVAQYIPTPLNKWSIANISLLPLLKGSVLQLDFNNQVSGLLSCLLCSQEALSFSRLRGDRAVTPSKSSLRLSRLVSSCEVSFKIIIPQLVQYLIYLVPNIVHPPGERTPLNHWFQDNLILSDEIVP